MAAIERKPYMDRIDRLKQRVLKTKPEMDLENAIILTKGFQESEGQPLCIRKAYAFKKQCLEKTVKIWGDELIVGNAGSKQRGGILSVDTCWSVPAGRFWMRSWIPSVPVHMTHSICAQRIGRHLRRSSARTGRDVPHMSSGWYNARILRQPYVTAALFTSTVNRFVAGARRLRVIPESLKKAWRESRCISIKCLIHLILPVRVTMRRLNT